MQGPSRSRKRKISADASNQGAAPLSKRLTAPGADGLLTRLMRRTGANSADLLQRFVRLCYGHLDHVSGISSDAVYQALLDGYASAAELADAFSRMTEAQQRGRSRQFSPAQLLIQWLPAKIKALEDAVRRESGKGSG